MTAAGAGLPSVALPVDAALPELHAALKRQRMVVVQAPPGTGKTTRVAPSLLGQPWLGTQRILMLEPRRVAARAAANRIAAQRGEAVGATVGLRTRFDTRVGPTTRIEVVTEGILTRMVLDDPSLDGVGCVIFDEFHERSIHADTALAFVRETCDALRDDLRLVAMSATLDASLTATRLGTDAIVRADAELHPVVVSYRPPAPGASLEDEVVAAVRDEARHPGADMLVFLPGVAAINRVARQLRSRLGDDTVVMPLHGSLPPAEQDQALLASSDGRRKVVLSTPLAETSVTIDGVGVVIDSGQRRRPEIDHGRGMSRLRTVAASQAACDQRAGRAGRQGPGRCVRLWAESEHRHRPVEETPEILTSDLTSLALQVAAWGASDVHELAWLDAPPAVALDAAHATLRDLGALDDDRRLSEHGRAMLALGAEPRLAHLMIQGAALEAARPGALATACQVAAALADRDLLSGRDRPADLRARLELLAPRRPRTAAAHQARQLADRWFARLADNVAHDAGVSARRVPDLDLTGALVSMAFPDRIAQRRAEPGSFLLASGAGVALPVVDGLAHEQWLAVAEIEGSGSDARVRLAAPLSLDNINQLHDRRLHQRTHGGWDRQTHDTVFEDRTTLGAIVVARRRVDDPDGSAVVEALLDGVRREGLSLLDWSASAVSYRARLAFVHQLHPGDDAASSPWPQVDDHHLLATIEEWLAPALGNARRRTDLANVSVRDALGELLDWRQRRELDQLAPTHVEVPSGSRLPIDYETESGPSVAVRLQEVFGLTESPTVGGHHRVPVVLHLLSPAHRPVQVTTDLTSFWADGYAEVRKDLRGRYPKHFWPDDPHTAPATDRTKPRR